MSNYLNAVLTGEPEFDWALPLQNALTKVGKVSDARGVWGIRPIFWGIVLLLGVAIGGYVHVNKSTSRPGASGQAGSSPSDALAVANGRTPKDEPMALVADANLSRQLSVVVVARVSFGGNVTPGPGDMEGVFAPVAVGQKDSQLEINKVLI